MILVKYVVNVSNVAEDIGAQDMADGLRKCNGTGDCQRCVSEGCIEMVRSDVNKKTSLYVVGGGNV